MKTKIEKIDRMQIDEAIMEEAGQIIKQGGLVAFPTVSYTHLEPEFYG